MGGEPSEIDCTLFGSLAQVKWHSSSPSPYSPFLKGMWNLYVQVWHSFLVRLMHMHNFKFSKSISAFYDVKTLKCAEQSIYLIHVIHFSYLDLCY